MYETKNNKSLKNSRAMFVLSALLALSLIGNFVLVFGSSQELKKHADNVTNAVVSTASAKEIYPMFICPCCGRTIDASCCGMAKERKVYVDGLTEGRLSKEEIVATYIKKYGLDSFKDEKQKQAFKKRLEREAPESRPIISINPEVYDLGDVSQSEGEVNSLFEIANSGKSDLIINKLETSCGCTSASVVYKRQEGPRFSMPGHSGENPDNWQVAIPSSEKAQLKVYYNPNVHKNFRGAAVREIYVFSNDPINFETKVKIELNQVD